MDQIDHADKWMLKPENIGENLSIDETSLHDDLFTFLSNKAGHCRQGTIVAAVRGIRAEDVISVLMQIPEENTRLHKAPKNGRRSRRNGWSCSLRCIPKSKKPIG